LARHFIARRHLRTRQVAAQYVREAVCEQPLGEQHRLTLSALVERHGTLLAAQPYGEAGLLVADLDLAAATGLLASRWKA
jgi:hypothetical protein